MTPAELREWREARGLTQSDLAAALGLSNPSTAGQVTVARWESGARTPPPYLPLALAEIERQTAR